MQFIFRYSLSFSPRLLSNIPFSEKECQKFDLTGLVFFDIKKVKIQKEYLGNQKRRNGEKDNHDFKPYFFGI